MNQHILIVTGTRNDLTPEQKMIVVTALNKVFDGLDSGVALLVLDGGANGVDLLARIWTNGRAGSRTEEANWLRIGSKLAGPVRNEQMLQWALVEKRMVPGTTVSCLAFPASDSRGTWDMVNRCKREGVPVEVVRLP